MTNQVEAATAEPKVSKRKLEGLSYPGPVCVQSPTHAHHYTVTTADVWQCKYCHVPVWMPVLWDDAGKFAVLRHKYGNIQTAYKVALSYRPKTVRIIKAIEAANKVRENEL